MLADIAGASALHTFSVKNVSLSVLTGPNMKDSTRKSLSWGNLKGSNMVFDLK